MFLCNASSGSPTCNYQWQTFETVGASYLRSVCRYVPNEPGAAVDAAGAASLWRVLMAAAKAVGFTPEEGTLDSATVINAGYFRLDFLLALLTSAFPMMISFAECARITEQRRAGGLFLRRLEGHPARARPPRENH